MQVWYGFDLATGKSVGGVGSSHWDSTVVVQPRHGLYSSDDPDVIAWQIDQMLDAGITCVMISWFGTGLPNLPFGFSPDNKFGEANHRATKAVLDHLLTLNGRMKASILVEPWPDVSRLHGEPFLISDSDKAEIWGIINYELYRPYKSVFLQWDGKPLVTAWMPMDIGPDNRFTYRRLSVYEDIPSPADFPMDWNLLDTTDANKYGQLISADGFRKVSPRFNSLYLYMSGRRDKIVQIDPYLREGWYDSQWEWVFDNRDDIKLLMVWTWNEYHEQNFIEPTASGSPLGVQELLRDRTRFYWNLFRSGQTFRRHDGPVANVKDLRHMVGTIDARELGLADDVERDAFLSSLLTRAGSYISAYLGSNYSRVRDWPAVEEAVLRLASNIYSYALKTRRGPLMQAGDFNVELNDDAVFTDAIKNDLDLLKVKRGIRVLYPQAANE